MNFVTQAIVKIKEAELIDTHTKKLTNLVEVSTVERILEDLEVQYLNQKDMYDIKRGIEA